MWVGLPKLVAAVSNAGGLGVLTGLTPGSPEKLRESIRTVRTLTNKPLYVTTLLPLPVLMHWLRRVRDSALPSLGRPA